MAADADPPGRHGQRGKSHQKGDTELVSHPKEVVVGLVSHITLRITVKGTEEIQGNIICYCRFDDFLEGDPIQGFRIYFERQTRGYELLESKTLEEGPCPKRWALLVSKDDVGKYYGFPCHFGGI